MAARKQLWHPDDVKDGRFYVYAVMSGAVCLYVGKGSGRRAVVSASRLGGFPEILRRFNSEDEAFLYERKAIAELQPVENKCAGGNGGRVKSRVKRRRLDPVEIGMRDEGPRRYVARFLARLDLSQYLPPSKIEAIRQVANGGWA